MKRLLLVIGLVAMFSLAASAKKNSTTTYNFQFLSVTGDPFCDGMYLYNYGNPQTLVDGNHVNMLCEGYNSGVNGFLAPVASNYQYGGSGNVMILSDSGQAYAGCNQPGHSTASGIQCLPSAGYYPPEVYLINPTTQTWTLWLTGGGTGEYVINYGTFDPVVGPLDEVLKPSQLPSSHLPKSSFER